MNKLLQFHGGILERLPNELDVSSYGDRCLSHEVELHARDRLAERSIMVTTFEYAPFSFGSSLGSGIIRCEADGVFALNNTEYNFALDELRNGGSYPMLLLRRINNSLAYEALGVVLFKTLHENDRLRQAAFQTWVPRASGWRPEFCHYFVLTQVRKFLSKPF